MSLAAETATHQLKFHPTGFEAYFLPCHILRADHMGYTQVRYYGSAFGCADRVTELWVESRRVTELAL